MVQNVANEAYSDSNRALKYHELDMLKIIEGLGLNQKSMRVLDLGCADGLFMEHVHQSFPEASIVGVELDDFLFNQATDRFSSIPNVGVYKEDVIKYNPGEKFDLIIASGIMTVFEDPFKFLDKYTCMLSSKGALVIFGRFNSFPINSKFMIKPVGGKEWIEPRVSFYTGEISDYLSEKGFSTHFNEFKLPIDLPKKDNPFASYTVSSVTGEKVVLCGANVVIETFFCTIRKG